MNELIKYINELSIFGLKTNLKLDNKNDVLKKLLVKIYSIYLNTEDVESVKEINVKLELSYQDIRKNVESNFPKFGYYIDVFDIHKIKYQKGEDKPVIKSGLGDTIDDLTDVVKDLLEIKWIFENISVKESQWQLRFLMRAHLEEHIVNLLKYLKDLES